MTRKEAYEYWRYKYEMAKDFDDPRWEGGEIREIRHYVDALATIVKMLEPPTCNADRIRSMSDEELAEWVAYNTSCETCPVKNATDYECHNTNCKTAWLSWLKSPVWVEVDNG